jgi:hypothetical protein
MVKHIVFMKLKDNSDQNKHIVKEKIMSMKGKIDVLKHIEVGLNFSPEERAYDLALVTEFDSKEDLKTYATHPEHMLVIAYLKSTVTVTKVVDYEY